MDFQPPARGNIPLVAEQAFLGRGTPCIGPLEGWTLQTQDARHTRHEKPSEIVVLGDGDNVLARGHAEDGWDGEPGPHKWLDW